MLLSTKETIKEHVWSFVKTAVSGFLSALAVAVTVLPAGTVFNVEFWKDGAVFVLLMSAVRAGVKQAWTKLPEPVGGTPK